MIYQPRSSSPAIRAVGPEGQAGAAEAHVEVAVVVIVRRFASHDDLARTCEIAGADDNAVLDRLLEAVLHHAQPGWRGAQTDSGTEVAPALEAVAELLRRTAHMGGIKFECATQEGAVSLSRDSLQQVLLNLALNALEATPPGGQVYFSNRKVAGPGAGFMEIQLDDDGEGVAPEDRERIFSAFQSARGDRPGGLGRPICRSLVQDAGGEIRLSSSANGGARLIIRLPVCETS